MIYAQQGQINQLAVTASRNRLDTTANRYLWSVTHKLSFQSWKFIPYMVIPSVSYEPGYNLFCVNIDDSTPQVFTGATGCDTGSTLCNVHLIPGEYYFKIYAQTSDSNLNPNLADEVVAEGMMTVVGVNQNNPITYSGDTDVFIMYNPDND
jgi:hypothetical protein